MKQNDKARLKRLDEVLRRNEISPHVATSIIKDSRYAYDVTKDLVKTGERLFSSGDAGVRSAERSLALDLDEVESLLDDPETEIEEAR